MIAKSDSQSVSGIWRAIRHKVQQIYARSPPDGAARYRELAEQMHSLAWLELDFLKRWPHKIFMRA